VLRRAEEYMRAHARERISLADVTMASECSERTLRYVFHERYGVSPMALLKRLRLQGLRRDLRDAAPRSTTVLDLALRWGFWHLGHLGRDYRLHFGETPSATLGGRTRHSLQGVCLCPPPPPPFESP
jgi:AraC family ethanolamine operon transcriptional activator